MYFPQNKAEYALSEDGSPNVLIDDFPPYIAAWRNKGGIAIEMRTDSFNSVEQIKSYITKELDEARKQLKGQVKESFNGYVERILSTFNA
jgi:hypothetical protein